MKRILETRTYTLQPGSGARCHALIDQESVPLLKAAGMDVVRLAASSLPPRAILAPAPPVVAVAGVALAQLPRQCQRQARYFVVQCKKRHTEPPLS